MARTQTNTRNDTKTLTTSWRNRHRIYWLHYYRMKYWYNVDFACRTKRVQPTPRARGNWWYMETYNNLTHLVWFAQSFYFKYCDIWIHYKHVTLVWDTTLNMVTTSPLINRWKDCYKVNSSTAYLSYWLMFWQLPVKNNHLFDISVYLLTHSNS